MAEPGLMNALELARWGGKEGYSRWEELHMQKTLSVEGAGRCERLKVLGRDHTP